MEILKWFCIHLLYSDLSKLLSEFSIHTLTFQYHPPYGNQLVEAENHISSSAYVCAFTVFSFFLFLFSSPSCLACSFPYLALVALMLRISVALNPLAHSYQATEQRLFESRLTSSQRAAIYSACPTALEQHVRVT